PRRRAHGAGGAARTDRVWELERCGFAPDGVERVVGAPAARELPHPLGHVALLGVPRIGGAELAGEGELALEQVARDDRPRPGQARALDAVEPDAAAPDHEARR